MFSITLLLLDFYKFPAGTGVVASFSISVELDCVNEGKTKMDNQKVTGKITLALVEDNVDFCMTVLDYLADVPEVECKGYAHDESAFQDLVDREKPDLVLLDINLSQERGGVTLLSWLREKHPGIKAVMMTVNESDVLECYDLGARGYLFKSKLENLDRVIREVAEGGIVIPPDTAEVLVNLARADRIRWQKKLTLMKFSDREMAILKGLKAGFSREKIGDNLGISYFTVRRHVQNLLHRAGKDRVKEVLEEYGDVL